MNLGPNVTHLKQGDRDVFLIGTAHISKKCRRSSRNNRAVQPDTVCVELCETRYQAMNDVDRWRKLDIFQVIRQKKGLVSSLSSLALSSYQRRMGEKLGVEPGAELKEAIRCCEAQSAEPVLVDRDIQATLKRMGKP